MVSPEWIVKLHVRLSLSVASQNINVTLSLMIVSRRNLTQSALNLVQEMSQIIVIPHICFATLVSSCVSTCIVKSVWNWSMPPIALQTAQCVKYVQLSSIVIKMGFVECQAFYMLQVGCCLRLKAGELSNVCYMHIVGYPCFLPDHTTPLMQTFCLSGKGPSHPSQVWSDVWNKVPQKMDQI